MDYRESAGMTIHSEGEQGVSDLDFDLASAMVVSFMEAGYDMNGSGEAEIEAQIREQVKERVSALLERTYGCGSWPAASSASHSALSRSTLLRPGKRGVDIKSDDTRQSPTQQQGGRGRVWPIGGLKSSLSAVTHNGAYAHSISCA